MSGYPYVEAVEANVGKHKLLLSIDENLYAGLKKLPREVSISDVFSTLLQAAVEELKMGHEMTDRELHEWVRKDPRRREVQKYLQDRLGPYVDVLKDAMGKIKK